MINSLADVRPGDVMLTDISGAPGFGVWLGEKILKDSFEIGELRVCHAGIVTAAGHWTDDPKPRSGRYSLIGERPNSVNVRFGDEYLIAPRLVQAMPHGAEEVELTPERHWTPRHVYVRMPEMYPGQAQDAASIARLMIGIPYSPLSYVALAAWSQGLKVEGLERWIDRRQAEPAYIVTDDGPSGPLALPVEAICSVLVDQAWTLAGARVCEGVAKQAVTPGHLGISLLKRGRDAIWGGAGILPHDPNQ